MVKLGAPLFSFAASGSLANAITYSNIAGRAYLKKKSDTPNPRTDLQISTRAMFTWLSSAWTRLSQPEKDSWLILSALNQQSAFNAYMAFNTGRWKNFLAPSKTPDAAELGTPSERKFNFGEYAPYRFRLRTWSAAQNDGWGTVIHMGATPDFVENKSNVILIIDDHDAAIRWMEYAYRPPVDRRFKNRSFTDDGYLGAINSRYTVNV